MRLAARSLDLRRPLRSSAWHRWPKFLPCQPLPRRSLDERMHCKLSNSGAGRGAGLPDLACCKVRCQSSGLLMLGFAIMCWTSGPQGGAAAIHHRQTIMLILHGVVVVRDRLFPDTPSCTRLHSSRRNPARRAAPGHPAVACSWAGHRWPETYTPRTEVVPAWRRAGVRAAGLYRHGVEFPAASKPLARHQRHHLANQTEGVERGGFTLRNLAFRYPSSRRCLGRAGSGLRLGISTSPRH